MINFDTTPNDTAKALSYTFPLLSGADNVNWEAVEIAVAALAIRQAQLGLTPLEMAYLLMAHMVTEGDLTSAGFEVRTAPNPKVDAILLSLHKKGLIDDDYSTSANTLELPSLTELGLAVCEWLLQTFGYSGQSTTYTPDEIIEELDTMPKEARIRPHTAPRLSLVINH